MSFYKSNIVGIGPKSEEIRAGGMIILFSSHAPQELKDYCVIHENVIELDKVSVGNTLILGNISYLIRAVGDLAEENLRSLGHVTLKFDGAEEAELPGTIHLNKSSVPELKAGDIIEIR